MLGSAKTAISSVVTPADYSVFISPDIMFTSSQNGGTKSAFANANIIGGTGPFTYEWVSDGAVLVVTPTNEKTSFGASGYNTEVSSNITLTVTDTGNANLETTSMIEVTFLFGVQP